jgi:hypothetical protein
MQVVVSSHNRFVDNVLANTTFGVYYGCSLLALRPRGNRSQPLSTLAHGYAFGHGSLSEHDSTPLDDCAVKGIEVSARKLKPGDVLLALAPKDFEDKWRDSDDFLMITSKRLMLVKCAARFSSARLANP